MKKAIVLLIIFGIAAIAKAIVIVPPVIYIASFSIGSFIFNALAFVAVIAAAKGISNKFYFGKKLHEIVGILLSFLGSSLMIISASVISVMIFDPIEIMGVFYASLFSAILCFIAVALYNVRRYALVEQKKKNEIMISAMSLFAIVFWITFLSANYSIQTSIFMKNEKSEALNGAGEGQLQVGVRFSPMEKAFREEAKNDVKKENTLKEILWFMPYKEGNCEIYGNGLIIKKEEPRGKCFYYNNEGETIRTKCPINLGVSDLDPAIYRKSSRIMIEGRGSCNENYSVIIMSDGFKNIP